jgi:glycosyltransferase involved in cell wall biosynthesis
MDASIVIRTYNEAKYLADVLAGCAAQDQSEYAHEVVVVDSGSTDGTLGIAERYGCRIVHIKKSEFTFGRSLNIGCEAARGRFLVFISGHCIPVGEKWLANLVRPLDQNRCVFAYGRQIGRKGVTKFSEEQLFKKYFPEHSAIPQDGFFCNNANSAVLAEVWRKYRFDETVTGLEDMVLGKQLHRDGHQIGYVADSIVEHLHEESWSKVKTRYEREAVALQDIMPEVHVRLRDFVRYALAGVLYDWSEALNQRVFWREAGNILMFRLMQYWGSYRGNNDHRVLSQSRKDRYFYPR